MSFSKVGIAASSFPDKDKWVDVKEQRTTGLPWAVQPIFELQPGICCAGFPLFARNKIFSPPAEVMDYKGGGGGGSRSSALSCRGAQASLWCFYAPSSHVVAGRGCTANPP